MKCLLLILTLLTIACGPSFEGSAFEDTPGAAGELASAGASPVGGNGGSTAGSGGQAVGGSAGSSSGAGGVIGGSGGSPSAGAGGVVACDEPEIVMPTALTIESWSAEQDGQCATMLEPLTCALTWSSVGWIDDVTYEVQIMSMSCGYPKFNSGSCDAGGTCEPEVHLTGSGHHIRLVVADDGVEQVLIQGGSDWGSYDIMGVNDNDCSPTVPTGWTGQLQAEVNRRFREILATATVECS